MAIVTKNPPAVGPFWPAWDSLSRWTRGPGARSQFRRSSVWDEVGRAAWGRNSQLLTISPVATTTRTMPDGVGLSSL